MTATGLLVVFSSPSGGGKTTILKRVLETQNSALKYSISLTTRAKRPGEIDAQDYFFVSKSSFQNKVEQGEFVEWEEVHGNCYGTLLAPLQKWRAEGRLVWLDLDVKGGLAIKKRFGSSALLVFIEPPSYESLHQRLQARKSETREQIEKRLSRYPEEMAMAGLYDYRIINEDIDKTIQEVATILKKHYSG
jgi:guanylate kinase